MTSPIKLDKWIQWPIGESDLKSPHSTALLPAPIDPSIPTTLIDSFFKFKNSFKLRRPLPHLGSEEMAKIQEILSHYKLFERLSSKNKFTEVYLETSCSFFSTNYLFNFYNQLDILEVFSPETTNPEKEEFKITCISDTETSFECFDEANGPKITLVVAKKFNPTQETAISLKRFLKTGNPWKISLVQMEKTHLALLQRGSVNKNRSYQPIYPLSNYYSPLHETTYTPKSAYLSRLGEVCPLKAIAHLSNLQIPWKEKCALVADLPVKSSLCAYFDPESYSEAEHSIAYFTALLWMASQSGEGECEVYDEGYVRIAVNKSSHFFVKIDLPKWLFGIAENKHLKHLNIKKVLPPFSCKNGEKLTAHFNTLAKMSSSPLLFMALSSCIQTQSLNDDDFVKLANAQDGTEQSALLTFTLLKNSQIPELLEPLLSLQPTSEFGALFQEKILTILANSTTSNRKKALLIWKNASIALERKIQIFTLFPPSFALQAFPKLPAFTTEREQAIFHAFVLKVNRYSESERSSLAALAEKISAKGEDLCTLADALGSEKKEFIQKRIPQATYFVHLVAAKHLIQALDMAPNLPINDTFKKGFLALCRACKSPKEIAKAFEVLAKLHLDAVTNAEARLILLIAKRENGQNVLQELAHVCQKCPEKMPPSLAPLFCKALEGSNSGLKNSILWAQTPLLKALIELKTHTTSLSFLQCLMNHLKSGEIDWVHFQALLKTIPATFREKLEFLEKNRSKLKIECKIDLINDLISAGHCEKAFRISNELSIDIPQDLLETLFRQLVQNQQTKIANTLLAKFEGAKKLELLQLLIEECSCSNHELLSRLFLEFSAFILQDEKMMAHFPFTLSKTPSLQNKLTLLKTYQPQDPDCWTHFFKSLSPYEKESLLKEAHQALVEIAERKGVFKEHASQREECYFNCIILLSKAASPYLLKLLETLPDKTLPNVHFLILEGALNWIAKDTKNPHLEALHKIGKLAGNNERILESVALRLMNLKDDTSIFICIRALRIFSTWNRTKLEILEKMMSIFPILNDKERDILIEVCTHAFKEKTSQSLKLRLIKPLFESNSEKGCQFGTKELLDALQQATTQKLPKEEWIEIFKVFASNPLKSVRDQLPNCLTLLAKQAILSENEISHLWILSLFSREFRSKTATDFEQSIKFFIDNHQSITDPEFHTKGLRLAATDCALYLETSNDAVLFNHYVDLIFEAAKNDKEKYIVFSNILRNLTLYPTILPKIFTTIKATTLSLFDRYCGKNSTMSPKLQVCFVDELIFALPASIFPQNEKLELINRAKEQGLYNDFELDYESNYLYICKKFSEEMLSFDEKIKALLNHLMIRPELFSLEYFTTQCSLTEKYLTLFTKEQSLEVLNSLLANFTELAANNRLQLETFNTFMQTFRPEILLSCNREIQLQYAFNCIIGALKVFDHLDCTIQTECLEMILNQINSYVNFKIFIKNSDHFHKILYNFNEYFVKINQQKRFLSAAREHEWTGNRGIKMLSNPQTHRNNSHAAGK